MSIVSTSGVHMYDEINEDDVKSDVKEESSGFERLSVLTIDNTYVGMPNSTSPAQYANEAQMNMGPRRKESATAFEFEGLVGQGRRPSNTRDGAPESGDRLKVPRHMSVDSVGYLMPGAAEDRKRTKLYRRN